MLAKNSQVFASYITQCILVVLLWFGLTAFEFRRYRRHKLAKANPTPQQQPEKTKSVKPRNRTSLDDSDRVTHEGLFAEFLVQFHKTQCYFSTTLQIASLSYGIFGTDMLITFMLTPIATNGVLPVIFAFVLLLRCRKASMDVVLLTAACWLLSSVVYWILYASIIPINEDFSSEERRYLAYQQFMYKLSAFDTCGGYSALAACPEYPNVGQSKILQASDRLTVLTPLIWSFSTICFVITLAFKFRRWLRHHNYEKAKQNEESEVADGEHGDAEPSHPDEDEHASPFLRSNKRLTMAYVVVTMCFLAGIGMQLSLLSIGTSLKMMNRHDWSFGQIVAVTIWAPPLLGYAYDELKKTISER